MIEHNTLFKRHSSNPILSAKDWPYSMNSVFNAGAILLADDSTLLLCRVEDRRGLSHLCVARSVNGVDQWQIDCEPTFAPDGDSSSTLLSIRLTRGVDPEFLWLSRRTFESSIDSA